MAYQRNYQINHLYIHSKGTILIIILVLCTLIAMLTNIAMESGILQLKMAHNFRSSLQTRKQVEEQVKSIEAKLSNEWISILPKEVRFLQFVPDTLMFRENKGASFYQIEAMRKNDDGSSFHLATTFSVRRKLNQDLKSQERTIGRLSSGQWISVHIFVHDELKKTQITILDHYHGNQIFQTTIKTKITSDILMVDSKELNFSDVAYMGDEDGNIWKLHFNDNWNITRHHILGMGKIKGPFIVGKHPHGKGVLIYSINENPFDQQLVLNALSDEHNIIKPFFICKNTVSTEQFVLWQGYLIASDANNKFHVYDSFTGEHQFTGTLSKVKELEYFQVIDSQLPTVLVDKPIDDSPVFLINTNEGMLYSQLQIKKNRLGRRTWVSKHSTQN